jgi:four helix bundle protein
LTLDIYRTTATLPKIELYGLVSQLRRASVSIASNIAEGKGRSSDREFILFLHHARGSLLEVETQLLIAGELKYVNVVEGKRLQEKIDNLGKSLNALINSLKSVQAA